MSNISVSKAELLTTVAKYRTTVEAQKGSATPYPAMREKELGSIDAFTRSVQDNPATSLADMMSNAREQAGVALANYKIWNRASMFGGLGLIAAGAVSNLTGLAAATPLLGTLSMAAQLGGAACLFIGSRIASIKAAEYNRVDGFASELENYQAYCEGQAVQPPGVGPNPQPAVCAQPPGVGPNAQPAASAQES
jgi:hypothetical protein